MGSYLELSVCSQTVIFIFVFYESWIEQHALTVYRDEKLKMLRDQTVVTFFFSSCFYSVIVLTLSSSYYSFSF